MENYERSHYEAKLDIGYAVQLHARHLRLFGRVRFFFTTLFLFSGTAVFAGLASSDASMARATGAAIALLAVVDHTWDIAGRIARHAEQKKNWSLLLARADDLDLRALDREIAALNADTTPVLKSLEMPSYNDNLRRHGREDWTRPLTRWERIMSALA